MDIQHTAAAIIPSADLDASQKFYERFGFKATAVYPHQGYRILHDAMQASIHLTFVEPKWVSPETNAHGIYLYTKDVKTFAKEFGQIAEVKPWNLTEFAISDPSGVLVRVGWPTDALPDSGGA